MDTDFKVDEKLKHFISRPTDEEKATLEELILKEGVKTPLTIWDEENVLIDGHTRLEICQKHNLAYKVDRVSFASKDHVTAWMVNNQMGRRNLTPEQMSYLRGERYEAEKGIRGGNGSNQHTNSNKELTDHNDQLAKGGTRKFVAKEYGVGKATIGRDFIFSKAVNTLTEIYDNPAEIKEAILSGKTKISKKAVKDIALVSESDSDLAKEQLKEALAPKEKKPRKKKAKKDELFIQPTPEMDGKTIVSDAPHIIRICISQLTRIRKDDPLKNQEFDKLIDWMEKNRK